MRITKEDSKIKNVIIILFFMVIFVMIYIGIVTAVHSAFKNGLYEGDYSRYNCTELNCSGKADGGVYYDEGKIKEYYCKHHFKEQVVLKRKYENRKKKNNQYFY